MKNLATCTPTEFILQTAKIKNAVANWLDVTKILEIRGNAPAYKVAPKEATAEERAEIIRENAALQREQVKKNLSEILDQMLVEHPQETLNVLALVCFVEPSEIDKYTMSEYIGCILEMFQDKSVISFFTLLAQMQQHPTSI